MTNGMSVLTQVEREQLRDLYQHDVWDGKLISREARNELVARGLVERLPNGNNTITAKGRKVVHRD